MYICNTLRDYAGGSLITEAKLTSRKEFLLRKYSLVEFAGKIAFLRQKLSYLDLHPLSGWTLEAEIKQEQREKEIEVMNDEELAEFFEWERDASSCTCKFCHFKFDMTFICGKNSKARKIAAMHKHKKLHETNKAIHIYEDNSGSPVLISHEAQVTQWNLKLKEYVYPTTVFVKNGKVCCKGCRAFHIPDIKITKRLLDWNKMAMHQRKSGCEYKFSFNFGNRETTEGTEEFVKCRHCQQEVVKNTAKISQKEVKKRVEKHEKYCLENKDRFETCDACLLCGEEIAPGVNLIDRFRKWKTTTKNAVRLIEYKK